MPIPYTTLLEESVNRVLRLDPETLSRLGAFDGKCIGVQLAGDTRDLEFFLFPSQAGLRIRATCDAAPDVTLRGDVPVFTRLIFGDGVIRRAGELHVRGDIELGQRFRRVLTSIDIDWEEQAAHVVGDIPAHQLGRLVRGLRAWGRTSRGYLAQDLREYLQEESRLLARRDAVDRFLGAVDTLRADVDRFEQRFARLIGKP